MLRGGKAGGDFAHPATVATTNANARAAAVRANSSGGSVVRGNFAADEFDLLRPGIGFRDRPEYKLVETIRNIFAKSRDDVFGGAINGSFQVGFRAPARRSQHRAHFLERALARRRDATEQDQSRFDPRVGASVAGRVVADLRHARAEFVGSLERREEAVGQTRRALQRRVGAAADPDIHRTEIVVGASGGPRLDCDVVEVEEAPMIAGDALAPDGAQHLDSFVKALAASLEWNSARGIVSEIRAGADRHHHAAARQVV